MKVQSHKDAIVKGWGRPHLYPRLAELGKALLPMVSRSSPDVVEAAVFQVDGFVQMVGSVAHPLVSSDGYKWHSAIEFKVDGGSFLVAVPYARGHGSVQTLERPPALYVKGRVDGVTRILSDMITAFKRY